MQGVPYDAIEEFLKQQGDKFVIPKATLWRNLQAAKKEVELPYAEEIAERWGGSIDIDAARELQRMILVQRRRVDKMVKKEEEKQKLPTSSSYFDKRIRAELETLSQMVGQYYRLMKSPMDAADERKKADEEIRKTEVDMTPETANQLADLLLKGKLTIGVDASNH